MGYSSMCYLRLANWRTPRKAVGLLFISIMSLSSNAWSQVANTLEIDAGGASNGHEVNATELHPANTPQVVVNADQAPLSVSVTTYHFNNRRNGWNNAEAVLNPANVGSAQFNLLQSVGLDEQIDAQPLILTNVTISDATPTDVVYVASENNTLYAIDANTGSMLLTRNFGPPVPITSLPSQCTNNSATVGINSTPVIDPSSGILYVMVYTLEDGASVFRLHAIDPTTLDDMMPPQDVSASQRLRDGSIYPFQANVSRQRAALLAANGNIYAAFASFCDGSANVSRGWILGWNARTLTPMVRGHLNNLAAAAPDDFFLTSVWMSGYGLAADASGALLFVTGNSDSNGTSYHQKRNLSESVVRIPPSLARVTDFFTPSNFADLEKQDADLGSGGAMLLPTEPGLVPHLIVAGGKDGRMFLLDRNDMGQLTPGKPDNVIGTFTQGPCWCGPSYFGGSDGVGRVVSSGGNQIIIWQLQTSPTTTLVQENATTLPNTIQDGGSFTTVSSNGTQADTAVIWTVSRPVEAATNAVTLYAIDPTTGNILNSQPAGSWPNLNSNANIVPVAANGKVYVASYKQLSIFGIGSAQTSLALPPGLPSQFSTAPPVSVHRLSGKVVRLNDNTLTLQKRNGVLLNVILTDAVASHQSVAVFVGANVEARGTYDATDALRATSIIHAKEPAAWAPDL